MAVPAAVAHLDQKSSAALAGQLRTRWRRGDALVCDHAFIYDLALLLDLHEDVPLLQDWSDPATVRGDGWERALADAAGSDVARARAVLRQPEDWAQLRCTAPRTWLVAGSGTRTALAASRVGEPTADHHSHRRRLPDDSAERPERAATYQASSAGKPCLSRSSAATA